MHCNANKQSNYEIKCYLIFLLPGTLEERGMIKWQAVDFEGEALSEIELLEDASVYEIPAWTKFLKKFKYATKVPFLPTYIAPKTDKKTK